MTEFLTSISDFFSSIGSVILNLVHGILYIVTVIPHALSYMEVLFAYLPVSVLPFAVCAIAICIVYLLVDR